MGPIILKDTGKYGRGLFASRDINKDELIEVSPAVISPNREWKYLKKTVLFYYCFYWGDDDTAIVLGLGSLFNHSYTPNITFYNNEENSSVDFYALLDIKEGEELTINYNGEIDDKSPLWFNVLE
ncbi:SET domain-containing protein [Rummeliibacillus sp. NPDC094406]|uniref:SET domain-containing protein n=1 Tax=Rummeliibacillus sp. NPDC094406 TaxID=3364511 RepID=UPI003803E44C